MTFANNPFPPVFEGRVSKFGSAKDFGWRRKAARLDQGDSIYLIRKNIGLDHWMCVMKAEKLIGCIGLGLVALLGSTSCATSKAQTNPSRDGVMAEGGGVGESQAYSEWIQALDVDQPLKVETATFALG